MAVLGQKRVQSHAGPSVKASRATSPPAQRPPRPRIGGGIRVVHSADGTSSSAASRQGYASHDAAESGPAPLYRRILYPNINERPPRILNTPGTEQVDEQLYTLLALICRGFISPWFSKISKDRAFFLEIVRVTSHVFRELEERLVDADEDVEGLEQVDKIRLVFYTVPTMLQRHIHDYQTAQARSKTAYSASIQGHSSATDLEALFHSLQPHAAINFDLQAEPLSPTTARQNAALERLPSLINADYVRTAVDAILEELLPPEDFNAETERSVVREVIVGIVLEGVFRKVTQPWFIYGLIAKLLDRDKASVEQSGPAEPPQEVKQDTWTRAVNILGRIPILFSQLVALFGYLSWLLTTSFASSHYRRYASRPKHLSNIVYPWLSLGLTAVGSQDPNRQTIAQLGRTAGVIATIASPMLDRIIVHYLYSRIFTPPFITKLLRTVEQSLFPEGFPAPAIPDPSPEEQVIMKEQAINALARCMPREMVGLVLPSDADPRKALASQLLEPFSSQFINTHLYLLIFDVVVANICPRLVLKGGNRGNTA